MNKSCKVSVMRTLNLLVYNVNCDIVAILPLVFSPLGMDTGMWF